MMIEKKHRMSKIPLLVRGNEEFVGAPKLKKDDLIPCPLCDTKGKVSLVMDRDGNEIDVFQFLNCKKCHKSYLMGNSGRWRGNQQLRSLTNLIVSRKLLGAERPLQCHWLGNGLAKASEREIYGK